jgi:alpha-glucoside transport system substrate-binding protein
MLIRYRQHQKEVDGLVEAYAEQRLGRRTFLHRIMATGLSLGAATSLLAACDQGSAPITSIDVLNVWIDEELESFKAVVEPFTKKTGIRVNLESTRNLNVALTIRLRGNDPPDLAVLPNPAQLRQMASQGQLIHLDTFLDMHKMHSDYASDWLDLASFGGRLYALISKAANKGTIWYNPTHFKAQGYHTPTTWQGLLALSDEIARSGQYPWSLGVENGAASGWPAADWIAEIYLRQFGKELYDQWVAHQIPWTHTSVRQAFQLFGQIVGGKHYVMGTPQTILRTDYKNACYKPFAKPPQAYMNYLGDFATGFITNQFPSAQPGIDFDFFPFPAFDARYTGAVTGSADLVVAMRDNDEVRQFMTYLSSSAAQAIWVKRGGATSVNKEVDLAVYPNDVARRSAHMLINATTFRFGADDMMPFAVEKVFWQQIQNFIADQSQLDTVLNTIEISARLNYSAS